MIASQISLFFTILEKFIFCQILTNFKSIFDNVKVIETTQYLACTMLKYVSLRNKSFRKFHRIMAEQVEFEEKFDTNPLGGNFPIPCSRITLRGRRALKCLLLLYESFHDLSLFLYISCIFRKLIEFYQFSSFYLPDLLRLKSIDESVSTKIFFIQK